MQMTIQVPDNLPARRLYQRIRELEDSLREEAEFITWLRQQTPVRPEIQASDPWDNPDLELACADTGIADFALNHDHYLYGVAKCG